MSQGIMREATFIFKGKKPPQTNKPHKISTQTEQKYEEINDLICIQWEEKFEAMRLNIKEEK